MRDKLKQDCETIDSTADALPEEVQDRLARILDDYLVALELGAPITPEELLARHPEDAAHLRGYLSGLELFHAAAVAPKAPQPLSLVAGKLQPAQVIGDFQLIRGIGRGGMGVVYEAEQLSLRRRVALKILPFTATHDPKQIGRFKNEAQAAAHVQHPHIVPVYAVGQQNGVHYYAMQFIDGQSLAARLHRAHPSSVGTTAPNLFDGAVSGDSLKARGESAPRQFVGGDTTMRFGQTVARVRELAQLGVQAAEALHAAHEYGIVHRDVKPSNLLVDEQGKLWVTDFGLARCRESSGLTQTGDILGTMRYMSPEQALGRGELIDHRTDIYSLGVTLYELATHHHPSGAASDVELLVDRQRFISKPLRHWNRHIPVDFQTIVLKSIAEFPHERYATAHEFSDDLGRFLEGKPILASPPNLVSRAGKWASRHRGLVAAAAAMLIIACAGLFATTVFMTRAKVASDRALAALDENFRQTHLVLDRFQTDAGLVDQLAAIPGADNVRQQLVDSSLTILEQFEHQAAGNPKLQGDLALVYAKMGGLIEKKGDKRLALERQIQGREILRAEVRANPQNAEAVRNLALAENNVGMLQAELGEQAAAKESLEKAQRLLQSLLSPKRIASAEVERDLATTYNNLGLLLKQSNDRDAAATKFRDAIAIQERLLPTHANDEKLQRAAAASHNNLGSLDESTDGAVAMDAYRQAIAIQTQLVDLHKENRIYQGDLARTFNNLGYVSGRRGDWSQAAACYSNAIQLQKVLVKASPYAASYRRDLAISYNNLGMVQSRERELNDAEASFRMAVDLQRDLVAAEPSDVQTLSNLGGVFNNLGLLADRQHEPEAAEEYFQQAVAFQRKALDVAPDAAQVRERLSNHYANYATSLRDHAKTQAADDIVRERDGLLAAQPSL